MKELVDKEKLIKEIKAGKAIRSHPDGETFFDQDLVLAIIESCTLSPAELADENLKALAVLEKLKVNLKDRLKTLVTGERSALFVYYKNALNDTLADIRDLESQALNQNGSGQAPPSDTGLAKEDRRKAELWDKVYQDHGAFLEEALRQKQEEKAEEKI